MSVVVQDTRDGGTVRAFEPRWDGDHWTCRGRLKLPNPVAGDSNTRQCGGRLQHEPEGQRWCGKCGGLVAWDGEVFYGDVRLRHLERTPA